MSHNYLKGGSKGNCTPRPVNGDGDFTVGGEPEMLGEDGKASPKDDLEYHAAPHPPSQTEAAPKSPDEALAEFGGLKAGGRFSSLKTYDGEKTSIPK